MPTINPRQVKSLREAAGLSRTRLAQQAHVSIRQLTRIESSDEPTRAHTTTARRLAKTFGVALEKLAESPAASDPATATPQDRTISPSRLKAARKRLRYSQQELAKKAGISRRHVARIESSDEPVDAKPRTLSGLSAALKVKPAELSGELPSITETPARSAAEGRMAVRMDPQTRLAYDLVERRYGPKARDVIDLAPLLFVLIAEGCLAWRRQNLEKAGTALETLNDLGEDNGQLYFTRYTVDVDWGWTAEQQSIDAADLLGDLIRTDDQFRQFNEDDLYAVTPFADFLRKVADELAVPERVCFGSSDLPSDKVAWGSEPFLVCKGDLEELSGGSRLARWALELGDIRISEIPEELLSEGDKDRRIAWIEGRLSPGRTRELLDECQRREDAFAKIDLDSLVDAANPSSSPVGGRPTEGDTP